MPIPWQLAVVHASSKSLKLHRLFLHEALTAQILHIRLKMLLWKFNVWAIRLRALWVWPGERFSFHADKLDGLGSSGKRKREDMAGMDHFLQLPDDYATRMSEPGKKRVNNHAVLQRPPLNVICFRIVKVKSGTQVWKQRYLNIVNSFCLMTLSFVYFRVMTSCFSFFFVKVRWADLEEQKDADRKRAIGFVVGQTDWERITDESGKLAQRALNRTKYF